MDIPMTTATAVVLKSSNGYMLKRRTMQVCADITIAEGDRLFRIWAHELRDEYAPFLPTVRIRLWGTDVVWEY